MPLEIKPGDRITEFVLEEKIGEGGFGEVWKARHHIFQDEFVAVKFPTDPLFIKSLRNEGATQHELNHPGIVNTRGLDPWHDPPYFIMEYVPGNNLRYYLDRMGRLSPEGSIEVFSQALEALRYAHEQGVVHGDIKPENIFLTVSNESSSGEGLLSPEYATVKIGDFGIARHTDLVEQGEALVQSSWKTEENWLEKPVIGGTYNYMAPELLSRESGLTPSSDLYSAGVVFYEMLMGFLPEGAFPMPSEELSGVPEELDSLINRLLHPQPERRYRKAETVLEDLKNSSTGKKPGDLEQDQNRTSSTLEQEEEEIPVAREIQKPFQFEDGTEVKNIREFVKKCDLDPDLAVRHLRNGDFDRWFREIGYGSLSRSSRDLRKGNSVNRRHLEELLQKTGLVAPPQPELDVNCLHFDNLAPGETDRETVYLTNYGRGHIKAKVRCESNPEWLRFRPRILEGDDEPLYISVDTEGMEAGTRHDAVLELDTGQETLSLEVSLTVMEPEGRLEVSRKRLLFFTTDNSFVRPLILKNHSRSVVRTTVVPGDAWIDVLDDRPVELRPGEQKEIRIRAKPGEVETNRWRLTGILEKAGFDSLTAVEGTLSLCSGDREESIPVSLISGRFFPGWFATGGILTVAMTYLPSRLGIFGPLILPVLFWLSWMIMRRGVAPESDTDDLTFRESPIDLNRIQFYMFTLRSKYLFYGSLIGVLMSLFFRKGFF